MELKATSDPKVFQMRMAATGQGEEILVDDYTAVIFKHPSDSSLGAISSKNDLGSNLDKKQIKEDFKTLPPLTAEQKKGMIRFDIDVYEQKQIVQEGQYQAMKFQLRDDERYRFPLEIIDTDYENYLITYYCHEQLRTAKAHDDLTLYWENYRKAVEEGIQQSPAQIGTLIKEQLFNDNSFDDF